MNSKSIIYSVVILKACYYNYLNYRSIKFFLSIMHNADNFTSLSKYINNMDKSEIAIIKCIA